MRRSVFIIKNLFLLEKIVNKLQLPLNKLRDFAANADLTITSDKKRKLDFIIVKN